MDSSTNMHHHQFHEEQLVDVDESSTTTSSTSLASSCFHTIVADDDHAWRNPTFFMNTNNNGNIHANCGDNEAAPNSLNNPIIQEMGFSWPNNNNNNNNNNNISINHQQQLYIDDRIKEEEPSSSTSSDHHHHYHHRHHGHDDNNPNFAKKFSDLLSSSTPSSSSSPNEMLLLKNTLSTSYKNLHQQQPSPFPPSMPYQNATTSSSSNNKGISTTFSQIFPSVNISNMRNNNNNNNMSSASTIMCSSSSGGTIDHQMASNVPGGFDLFATARLLSGETSINQCTPSNNNNLLELFEGSPRFRVDHDLQHHSNDLKLFNNNIIANNVAVSSFNNDRSQADSKKYNVMEQQSTTQPMATKKQRFESRSSCPPLKVRKEKLGDRIAALQQLVSPFGKTDTASVLMEAIGYIKFLQNQVETLSVPYMKLASRSKSSSTQRVSNDEYYCESEEQKSTDLKSRGLCLVPTSCMSYINIASDPINSGVWPPNFNPTSGF